MWIFNAAQVSWPWLIYQNIYILKYIDIFYISIYDIFGLYIHKCPAFQPWFTWLVCKRLQMWKSYWLPRWLHGAGLRQCLEFRSLELIWTLRIHNVNCSLQGITRPKFTFLTRTIEIPNWNCFQVKEGVETETNYNSNQEAM